MLKKPNKDFTFGDLPKVVTIKTDNILVEEKLVKVSADVSEDLREKVNDFAYQTGFTQAEIIIEALEMYFSDKKVPQRPLKVRERKVGRKRKE